jgi:hypothetical protein
MTYKLKTEKQVFKCVDPLCGECHTKYLDIDLSKDYNDEVKK